MEWQSLLAIGAVGIAALSLLDRLLDKSLSLREHEEYRKGVERSMDTMRNEYIRELDRIDKHISIIEQSRPTASELQNVSSGLQNQITEVKEIQRDNGK
jgi:methylthioribose-1-phosphate isomerase